MSIFDMSDEDKILDLYVSDGMLVVTRISRYISVFAPCVISSYLACMIHFFMKIND